VSTRPVPLFFLDGRKEGWDKNPARVLGKNGATLHRTPDHPAMDIPIPASTAPQDGPETGKALSQAMSPLVTGRLDSDTLEGGLGSLSDLESRQLLIPSQNICRSLHAIL